MDRAAVRAALAHGLAGGAAGLVLGLLVGRYALVASPCLALAVAVPAGAAGWAEARDLGAPRTLALTAAAGVLAVLLALVQGLYVFGVVVGGIEAGYANLAELADKVLRPGGWEGVCAFLGGGLGYGAAPGIVLLERRKSGETSLRVVLQAIASCLGYGLVLVLAGGAAGALMAVVPVAAQASAPIAVVLGLLAVPLAAGPALAAGAIVVPAWGVVLSVAERLDAHLERAGAGAC